MSTDTACSSAMVAAHLGVQHLGSHGGAVLAAGVNLMLAETTTAAAHAAGACSACGFLVVLNNCTHIKTPAWLGTFIDC